MSSSKFGRKQRIQPLPPICKKAPNPSEMWDMPLLLRRLQGYASWSGPSSGGRVLIHGYFTLEPDAENHQWFGRLAQNGTILELWLIESVADTVYNMRLEVTPPGGSTFELQHFDVPMRSFDPLETTDLNFVPSSSSVQALAAVMA